MRGITYNVGEIGDQGVFLEVLETVLTSLTRHIYRP